MIQLAPAQWLVLDDHVKPRFLITRGPLVSRETRETQIMHRIEQWRVEKPRECVAVVDGLIAVQRWCDHAIKKGTADAASQSYLSRDPRGNQS